MLHSEVEGSTFRLQMSPVVNLTEDEFFALCQIKKRSSSRSARSIGSCGWNAAPKGRF